MADQIIYPGGILFGGVYHAFFMGKRTWPREHALGGDCSRGGCDVLRCPGCAGAREWTKVIGARNVFQVEGMTSRIRQEVPRDGLHCLWTAGWASMVSWVATGRDHALVCVRVHPSADLSLVDTDSAFFSPAATGTSTGRDRLSTPAPSTQGTRRLQGVLSSGGTLGVCGVGRFGDTTGGGDHL